MTDVCQWSGDVFGTQRFAEFLPDIFRKIVALFVVQAIHS